MVMNPTGFSYDINGNPTNQVQYLPQLATSIYSTTDSEGNPTGNGSPSTSYSPPAANIQAQISKGIQQGLQQQQQNQQNQQDAQRSPIGITPLDAGKIVGKAINGGFNAQVAAIDNFGSGLGFGAGGPVGTGDLSSEIISPTLAAADASSTASITGGVADSGSLLGGETASSAFGTAGSITTTSLSSILGSVGIGALGGGLLAKLTGGNQVGGSIGGAIGAGLGAAAMGTELGAAIGTLIPIPGLGTILGGAVGGLIGGAFGNHSKPTAADESGITFAADGTIKEAGYGSKHPGSYAGYAKALDGTLSNVFSGASKELGINFDNSSLRAGYNSLHSGGAGGGFIQVNGNNYTFDPSDTAGKNQAIFNALSDAAKASGYTNTDALNTYYKKITAPASNTFSAQAAPSVSLSGGTFADFMNKTKGNSNGNGSASTTPTV